MSLTATNAAGLSTANSRVTVTLPRISHRPTRGALSNSHEPKASRDCSLGKSPGLAKLPQSPEDKPVVCGERSTNACSGAASAARRPGLRWEVCDLTCGLGQLLSATQ